MSKTVTIVGAGALGSHLVLFARNWKCDFRVIDFDTVESKNILSQFHTKMGLGKNKTTALQQLMLGLFGSRLQIIPYRLGEGNIETVLGESALIIDCTDNAATRRLIRDFAVGRGTPCLHGALSADGSFARVIWTEHFIPDKEGAEGQATCEDGENLQFFALAACHLARVAKAFIDRGEKKSFQLGSESVIRLS